MNIDSLQIEKMLEWLKTKLKLDAMSANAKRRTVKRGQVYRCNFGCGIGSEMNKERPAVVIQNDIGNLHSGNTIVIPITHDTSTLPCVASINPQIDVNGNIILDGQANASNILCVSKARLGDYICELSNRETYIEKIKNERNQAQDELAQLRKIININDKVSLTNSFKK